MPTMYIHTFGCKVNQYDSQVMRERLACAGYIPAIDTRHADIVVVNSCTVTAEAGRQCRQLLRKILDTNKKTRLIVAGCYPQHAAEEIKALSARIEVLPAGTDITDYLGARHANKNPVPIISTFEGHSRAFVKIQDGCNTFCSYCIVPFVRPVLWSKPEDDVLHEVRQLVANGYPEIVLTGVQLAHYQGGLKSILEKVLKIDGDFRLRLSSVSINAVTQGLLEVMQKNPKKICPHLHVSLQSGSERILKRMQRPYTITEFIRKAEAIHRYLPDAGLTTDVIVGFPGETEGDFRQTVDVINRLRFSRLHVFRYSKRPGTKAAEFNEAVPDDIVKQRSAILKKLDVRLQEMFWRHFIGTQRFVVQDGEESVLSDNYIKMASPGPGKKEKVFLITLGERKGMPVAV